MQDYGEYKEVVDTFQQALDERVDNNLDAILEKFDLTRETFLKDLELQFPREYTEI